MTKFHEVHTDQYLTELVDAPELENLIGKYIIWQDPYRVPKSLGKILEVNFNMTSVLVKVSTESFFRETRKFSFTKETKVRVIKQKK